MRHFFQTKDPPTQRKPHRLRVLLLPVMGIVLGSYILITVLSPMMVDLPIVGQDTKRQKETVTRKLADQPGTHGNRLYIPPIGVDVAIVTGTDASVLDKGAWHRKPENGNPEKGGNFVLSAHRFLMGFTPQQTSAKSPFYHIDKLNVGDKLFVDFNRKRYGYIIAKKYRVEPTQVAIEGPSTTPKLTLYSCTLYGAADGRDVIEATPMRAL